jgi:hypothetical protein
MRCWLLLIGYFEGPMPLSSHQFLRNSEFSHSVFIKKMNIFISRSVNCILMSGLIEWVTVGDGVVVENT